MSKPSSRSRPQGDARPHGEIRESQLVRSFGPGAMVDLPNHSVLIGGLDDWTGHMPEVVEPRLLQKIAERFDPPRTDLMLKRPPSVEDTIGGGRSGLTVWQFPEWFITQPMGSERSKRRSRRLIHRKRLLGNRLIYEDNNRVRHPVVPIRFVRACTRGHIEDINWIRFVHEGGQECLRSLWMDERGTSGDLAEVYVRCECGRERSLAQAAMSSEALGRCIGRRPWLGNGQPEGCGLPNRLLIRTASNAYFPQLMSAITLPDRNETLKDAVTSVWEEVGEMVQEPADLAFVRRKAKVDNELAGFDDADVFAMIQTLRGGGNAETRTIKQAELETLISCETTIGEDRPDGDFFARTLPAAEWNASPTMDVFERVVRVHRLREVVAQVGFTRFESVTADIDGELDINVESADLSRTASWLPAIENRGEGVFLQVRREAIEEWLKRPAVQARGERLLAGYHRWKADHNGTEHRFAEEGGLLPYVMLHSLSHLLITAISLECGYPASSIRERVYSIRETGYGILLLTGSSDSEGTLGGLVQIAARISEHVAEALRLGSLCSNDPVCSQHEPSSLHDRRFLHGAACHGCLLTSETSCERHNEYLDRTLVVPTIEQSDAAFFDPTAVPSI